MLITYISSNEYIMHISWIYHGCFVRWLVHNNSNFADAANASSGDTCRQWLLRLRRLEHKVGLCLCPKMKSLFEGKAMFDLLLDVSGASSAWKPIECRVDGDAISCLSVFRSVVLTFCMMNLLLDVLGASNSLELVEYRVGGNAVSCLSVFANA